MNFHLHYMQFLGLPEHYTQPICQSMERTHPLNHTVTYAAIAAEYQGNSFLSVAPQLFHEELKVPAHFQQFAKVFPAFTCKRMQRFSKESPTLQETSAVFITPAMKALFMASLAAHKTIQEKEKTWADLFPSLEARRCFGVLIEEKIVALAYLSDIYLGAGNIVVNTLTQYRNHGHGTQAVLAALNWCSEQKILPIYVANDDNAASLALARKVGLKHFATEWVAADYS